MVRGGEILALPILNKRYSRIYLLARTCAAYVSRITYDGHTDGIEGEGSRNLETNYF